MYRILFIIITFLSLTCRAAETNDSIHVVVLGDSNTWLGGDECEGKRGWTLWFKQLLNPSSCRSYARSGATWTNTTATNTNVEENIEVLGNDNVIFNQVQRLKNAYLAGNQIEPTLIIIAAGTNDAWFTSKRPQVFSKTADVAVTKTNAQMQPNKVLSLAESVVYNCALLRDLFPKTCIVLLTPMQSTAVKGENITRAGDIIERCAELLDLPVIRQDKVMKVVSSQEKRQKQYTYDGTHTSEKGAKSNGTYIAEFIKRYYGIL